MSAPHGGAGHCPAAHLQPAHGAPTRQIQESWTLSPKRCDVGQVDSYGCCRFLFLAESRLSLWTGSALSQEVGLMVILEELLSGLSIWASTDSELRYMPSCINVEGHSSELRKARKPDHRLRKWIHRNYFEENFVSLRARECCLLRRKGFYPRTPGFHSNNLSNKYHEKG